MMDAQLIFQQKINRIKDLFSQLTDVSNNISDLCDLNGSTKTKLRYGTAKPNVHGGIRTQPISEFEPTSNGNVLCIEHINQSSDANVICLNNVPQDVTIPVNPETSHLKPCISALGIKDSACTNVEIIIDNNEGEDSFQFDCGKESNDDGDIEIIVDDFADETGLKLKRSTKPPRNVDHRNNKEISKSTTVENEKTRHKGCDITKLFVPTSDGKSKKLCCMFCLNRYQKLERHLRTVHKDEAAVKNFVAFPPRSKNRRDLIAKIRLKGEFMWNSNFKLNGGEMQTSRRPNKKCSLKPWQLVACSNCMGSFSNNTLRHHWRNCTGKSIVGDRIAKQLGRALESRIHADATDDLNKIFSKFRDNESIRMIQFDWLVICYGNELCLNYSPHYQEGYICSKVRAAAKLLDLSKALLPDVSDLASLFHVKHCDKIVDVIRQMGKYDPCTKLFGSPGTASTTVTLINTIVELLTTESMKLDDETTERNAERFSRVFKRDVKTKINKLVAITIATNRRHKKPNIPTTADINKLALFLDTERDACLRELMEKYSYQTWFRLSQLTLVSILVFNRRRAGEMRNITITDFTEREIIDEQCDMISEAISQQNNLEIKSRMHIRGKLGRTVPVLLKNSWENCIRVLIDNRRNAGLPEKNEFLFAIPTQSFRVKTINVWAAINSYAMACGAENPSSLKGTNLRKHLASFCATKKLCDRDVTNIAEYMGHDERIHLKIYRQNPLVSQLSQIAPILNNAQGNDSYRHNDTKKTRKIRTTKKTVNTVTRKIQGRKITKPRQIQTVDKSSAKIAGTRTVQGRSSTKPRKIQTVVSKGSRKRKATTAPVSGKKAKARVD